MDEYRILSAIGSTAPSTFSEFLRGLMDAMPAKNDKAAWRELFLCLEDLERRDLVEIERADGRIDNLVLTYDGAYLVRARMDEKRGLFGGL